MQVQLCDVRPRTIVRVGNVLCSVLNNRIETCFLMALDGFKTIFGDTSDFSKSELRKYLNSDYITESLMCDFSDIDEREIDLTAAHAERGFSYGKCRCGVAPLTIWAEREYQDVILLDNWDTLWTVTPIGTKTLYAMSKYMNIDHLDCNRVGVCRPTFLLKGTHKVDLVDDFHTVREELKQYSTNDLLGEINRRINEGKKDIPTCYMEV